MPLTSSSAWGVGWPARSYLLYAAAGVFVSGACLLYLALLDHPHYRGVLLAEMCERHAAGKGRANHVRYIGHAVFLAALVLTTGLTAMVLLLLAGAFPAGERIHREYLSWLLYAVVAVFGIGMAEEVSLLAFANLWAQALAGASTVWVLFVLAIVPPIHVVLAYEWHRSRRADYGFALRETPTECFVSHHFGAVLLYGFAVVAILCLLLFLRRRVYARLEKIAERAARAAEEARKRTPVFEARAAELADPPPAPTNGTTGGVA